jgi:hypothetical protein
MSVEGESIVKRILAVVAAAVCACGFAGPVLADGDCGELHGDESILPGELLGKTWKQRDLPSKGDMDDVLTRLDANEEGPLVLAVDLNRDGRAELLLTSPGDRLCGNAGCPYILLDPKTFKRIGEFFGHLAILDERVNGYRIIQSFSRYRVSASSLDTYVFDRGAYRLVSHVIVDACGLEQWLRRMREPK